MTKWLNDNNFLFLTQINTPLSIELIFFAFEIKN